MDSLQNCFEYTDWDIFKQAATHNNHTDLNTYTSSVLDYITFCMNSVITQRTILTLPNHKPWMNGAVTGLLKARDAAFDSGDAEAYRTARSSLRKGIREAKPSTATRSASRSILTAQTLDACGRASEPSPATTAPHTHKDHPSLTT